MDRIAEPLRVRGMMLKWGNECIAGADDEQGEVERSQAGDREERGNQAGCYQGRAHYSGKLKLHFVYLKHFWFSTTLFSKLFVLLRKIFQDKYSQIPILLDASKILNSR